MKSLSIFLIIPVLLVGGEALATHKAWVLKNSGGQCAFIYPSTNDAYPGLIENTKPFGVYVSCPITLASRGGSASSPLVLSKMWMAAKHARVFFEEVRSPFWCRARAEDLNGNVFFGATHHWSPGDGFQSIDLIDAERDWGGSLEMSQNKPIISLDFECRLGSGDSSNPAKLFGYDVAICQSLDWCDTVRLSSRGGEATVQGSGIECAPSSGTSGPFLRRSVHGMTNRGDATHSTHCPITQATDDSYEHSRDISGVEVHFSGPRPICQIESFDARGEKTTSPNLEFDPSFRTLRWNRSHTIGREKSLSLQCELPPNSTLEGYVVRMSVTRKSGGL